MKRTVKQELENRMLDPERFGELLLRADLIAKEVHICICQGHRKHCRIRRLEQSRRGTHVADAQLLSFLLFLQPKVYGHGLFSSIGLRRCTNTCGFQDEHCVRLRPGSLTMEGCGGLSPCHSILYDFIVRE